MKKRVEVQIKNLLVRCIVGINDWEREKRQDIIINISLSYDGTEAVSSDKIEDAYNYRTLSKRVVTEVEKSNFFLIEKLSDYIMQIIMEDSRVQVAKVKVEKPHALRYSESVSVTIEEHR